MRKINIFLALSLITCTTTFSQDTFSIVAVDTVTGEVGGAGASCVDLFQTGFTGDDFLSQLIPNVGAINTQAYYLPANQDNARNRMNLGETPSQIVAWLNANDVQSQPEIRQYGIVTVTNGLPAAAAFTGSQTDNYKGHIVGRNYAIQGNILLGQQVLDSMEARFLREKGDLACKLMAALQGAKMVGADSRCAPNGTSSLFAFVKVAQPTDTYGNPSFKVSVRTMGNSQIEPIDSLQTKFALLRNCGAAGIIETKDIDGFFTIYPNPSTDIFTVKNSSGQQYILTMTDLLGKLVKTQLIEDSAEINTANMERGVYLLKLVNGESIYQTKVTLK